MQSLIGFDPPSSALPKLLNRLLDLRRQRNQELEEIADIFGDPEQLAKYYVEPDCQHINPADDPNDDPLHLPREPLFRMLKRFLSSNTMARGGRAQLFVLSDAGMGKTSLLIMMKLLHLTSFWPTGFQCNLMKLGPSSLEKIAEISKKKDTVLLLDALDEDPLARGNIQERINNILAATHSFRQVIITCRTQFFPETQDDPFSNIGTAQIGAYACPITYLSLLSDDQVKQYLVNRFPRTLKQIMLWRPNPRVAEAFAKITMMNSLKSRPMLLANIDIIMESSNHNLHEFTIYDSLVRSWLYREERKRSQRGEENIPPLNSLWRACTSLAMELHSHQRSTISLDEIEALITSQPDLFFIKTFDVGGRSLLNRRSDGEFRFSHQTIQEFLLADRLLKMEPRKGFTETTDQMRRFISSYLRYERKPHQTISLPNVDLSKIDLSDIDLTHIDLTGTALRQANLARSIINNTVFAHGDLTQAILRGLTLTNADLTHTKMEGTDLSEADLRGIKISRDKLLPGLILDLSEANLEKANLSHCNLDNVNFQSAIMTRANLEFASLRGANLRGANLDGANLANADLRGADLRGARMFHTELGHAILENTMLTAAEMKEARLMSADLSAASIEGKLELPSSVQPGLRGTSLGSYLRRKREQLEITLQDISEATKIGINHLEAIELDQFHRLPGEVFTKNWIAQYAECVGILDIEGLMQFYHWMQNQMGTDGERHKQA